MFFQNAFLLLSDVVKDKQSCGGDSIFKELLTRKGRDGLVLRGVQGGYITEMRTNKWNAAARLVIVCSQLIFDTEIRCAYNIDDVFAERIVTYMRDHYGKHHTNCSTFVEFVRTGNFRGCDLERVSFMFSGGMNSYTGQKIRPGDSVCVFYYDKRGGSRRISAKVRNHWRRAGKNVTGDLKKLEVTRDRSWSQEQLLDLCSVLGVLLVDYHFMICIGVRDGEPIFIQQLGQNEPAGENIETPIVASIGMTDVMGYKRPAIMFLKRRR